MVLGSISVDGNADCTSPPPCSAPDVRPYPDKIVSPTVTTFDSGRYSVSNSIICQSQAELLLGSDLVGNR